jgi:hypothetical protein
VRHHYLNGNKIDRSTKSPITAEQSNMENVTINQAADLLEVMTITQSIDSGFAITHHGHIEGVPTIIISTYRGAGDCYIIQ